MEWSPELTVSKMASALSTSPCPGALMASAVSTIETNGAEEPKKQLPHNGIYSPR